MQILHVKNLSDEKVKVGDIVEKFDEVTRTTTSALVVDIQNETEYGADVFALPIKLSGIPIVRQIQAASIRRAFQ